LERQVASAVRDFLTSNWLTAVIEFEKVRVTWLLAMLRRLLAELTGGGTDHRNGVSFDQQDGSAVGGFQGTT
jgi:hypothetical protein